MGRSSSRRLNGTSAGDFAVGNLASRTRIRSICSRISVSCLDAVPDNGDKPEHRDRFGGLPGANPEDGLGCILRSVRHRRPSGRRWSAGSKTGPGRMALTAVALLSPSRRTISGWLVVYFRSTGVLSRGRRDRRRRRLVWRGRDGATSPVSQRCRCTSSVSTTRSCRAPSSRCQDLNRTEEQRWHPPTPRHARPRCRAA